MTDELVARAKAILEGEGSPEERLRSLCQDMHDRLDGYDWVGFYLVDPGAERELFLGPYVGAPTDHVRIPFGRGICGQAAESLATFVVDDVTKEENYLACSTQVQSEIVIPVFGEGRLVGELDIDSHVASRFGPDQRAALEEIARMAGPLCAEVADEGPRA